MRYSWTLIKWLWNTVADAVRAILVAGIVGGVRVLIYRSRDRLVDLCTGSLASRAAQAASSGVSW